MIAWNVETFGERFDHIHLNILGKGRAYLNPFELLELLPDKSFPEILNFKVIQGAVAKDNSADQGTQYTIAAEIRDLVLSDVFVVPPNEIHLQPHRQLNLQQLRQNILQPRLKLLIVPLDGEHKMGYVVIQS